MMVNGKWLDNTTCKRCRFRHPPELTCAQAQVIAEKDRAGELTYPTVIQGRIFEVGAQLEPWDQPPTDAERIQHLYQMVSDLSARVAQLEGH